MLFDCLPAVNAALNATCAALLTAGYWLIRRKKVAAHRACMTAAFGISVLFLVSYLTYHALHGSTRFPGAGAARVFYFTVLITHTVLAALVPPLALWTLSLAWRNRIPQHARWARWTLPLWLYVSVTGVVVYWMLYQTRWN